MSDVDSRIKRLIYQSQRRGTREADFLLGSFATKILPFASESFISEFEELLCIPDPLLVAWLMGYSQENPAPDNGALEALRLSYTCTLDTKD